jgi:sirohydrochlorin cobaltochelatase
VSATTPSNLSRKGLVLFAHGARDPEWAKPFRAIAKRVSDLRPDFSVRLAFLEFQTPTLSDGINELVSAGHQSIHIAPLFMAQGGHLKNDVPKLLAAIVLDHPQLQLTLLEAIGDVPALREAIADWLVSSIPEH